MSLYSFATSNLTTAADRRRRPAIDKGQIIRTMILCVLFLVALGMMTRRGDAAESGFHGFVESLRPQAGPSARPSTAPLPGSPQTST